MKHPASILIYGRDLSLLESRGWVLEKAGYRVSLALNLKRVKELASSEQIDLLLICHSLSPEDCEDALDAMGPIRPKARRLLMTANTVVAPALAEEASVSAFEGPVAMLVAVKRLISAEDHAGIRQI